MVCQLSNVFYYDYDVGNCNINAMVKTMLIWLNEDTKTHHNKWRCKGEGIIFTHTYPCARAYKNDCKSQMDGKKNLWAGKMCSPIKLWVFYVPRYIY